MYGDLCQMTYDNYIRDQPTLDEVKGGLSDEQKEERSAFQTGAPRLGGFKYLPSELMELPRRTTPSSTGPHVCRWSSLTRKVLHGDFLHANNLWADVVLHKVE